MTTIGATEIPVIVDEKLEDQASVEAERGTARALRQAFSVHFAVHADEWMKIQTKLRERYSYRGDSTVEKCRICAALGSAIAALEEDAD